MYGGIGGAILKKQHEENKRYAELTMEFERETKKPARL